MYHKPLSLNDFQTSAPQGGLRILHIFRAPLGGLFRHVCDLAAEQARMGHQVGIVCDTTTGGAHGTAQLERMKPVCSLGVLRIPMGRMPGFGDIAALAAIRAHVAKLQPDVLHGHGAKGGAYASLMPRAEGRIALYTPHGGALHYKWLSPVGAVFLGLEKWLRGRSDGVLFESAFGERAYASKVGALGCPTRVVPNGLGDADFAPLDSEPVYDAVFVGELRKLKGLSTLIEACAKIAAERPFKLAIAGTGPDEALFRKQIAAKGLGAHVDFLGHCPAREVFSKGRMIVVPSYAESFPYVVLEAIASARPTIATDVGGIPGIFGPYGALVQPGDAAALAEAMRTAMDRPELVKKRAEVLQDRARILFAAKRMAEEVTNFYGALAKQQTKQLAQTQPAVNTPETAIA